MLKYFNFKILFTILTLLIASCAPSIKTERVSLEKSDKEALTITDEWVATDTETAVQNILKQINDHRGFQNYLAKLGRRPKVFVGEIQNNTSEAYFPIEDLNDEFLNILSQSGDYIIIDEKARNAIIKEIKYQNDGMVKSEDIKRIGKASGADLIILGNINMKPETLKGRTVKDYSVNLRMTDIESGEEVLRTRVKSSKYSKRSGTSW